MEIQSFRGMHSEIDKFNLSPDQSPDCSCVRLDPIGDLSKTDAGYRKFLLSSLYDSDNAGLTIHSHKTGGYYQHFVVDDGDSGRVVSIGDLVKSNVNARNGDNTLPDLTPERDEEWEEVEDTIATAIYSLAEFNDFLYAGTSSVRIYRTSNGTTWTTATDLPESFIWCLTTFGNYLYAGVGVNGKIYRTANGTTWNEVEDGTATTRIYSLAEFDNYLYAGQYSNGKIFRSSDGTTWVEVHSFELEGANTVRALIEFNSYLYAGTGTVGKIFRSSDGTTWTEIEDTAEEYVWSLSTYNGYLYAGSDEKIYRTKNGINWVEKKDTGEVAVYSLAEFGDFNYAGTGSEGKIFRGFSL